MTSARNDDPRSIEDLARKAIGALRALSDVGPPFKNQQKLVEAASAVEEIARRLRGHRSGRDVILELLQAVSPDEISKDFLRHASGIQEFGRRIRELRVELGYDVESTGTGYRLVRTDPDLETALKWAMMNDIRRRKIAALDRIRTLFLERQGEIITTQDIAYVSKISSGPRRVRELRTEHGLRIESHKDNPSLHPGQYVLIDPEPIPAAERQVSARLRERVLERDGYACTSCGREPDRARRVWLEVDHILPLKKGGANEQDNLRTLCNHCHRAR